ncbi:undecaprenyl-diphosphate phosphatase [Anaerosporobacter faecicola]|uniref:undecaprenyl-diphosphate phosphatase n=1 Tax=Anaerosporobacter faecicola TaxID=2718714 RepID=UPI001438A800|nr:undecaprenyl-diphosphate phosphatase [Anaerosporobacter faecicola]
MTIFQAIIMGILQGVAEFLPISSSGHLAIMKQILHMNTDTGLLFDVMLHFGTLLAVFLVFWKDIKKLIIEGFGILGDFFVNVGRAIHNLFHSQDKKEYKKVVCTAYRKFVMLVIVSTIPTGILALLFRDVIEVTSETLLVPGLCLLLTAVLLLIADRTAPGKKRANDVSYANAGIIGLAQGFATLPGLSRSGTTITACLSCGLYKNFAVKYSFIMSIPAILGAVILQVKDFGSIVASSNDIVAYIIGTCVAAVVGYICMKTMLVIVRGKKYKGFAYYCFVVGMIAIIWNFVA